MDSNSVAGGMPAATDGAHLEVTPRPPAVVARAAPANQPGPAPAVSVLMTVYNSRPYLAEAIDSILAQTFRDFEFVIVDDGSTDGSLEMLREYERRDGRIRLYERPHSGIVPAANFGLRQCRGSYLARMDGDDIAMPRRFEWQVRALDENPAVVVVGGAYELIDAGGRLLRHQWPPLSDEELQPLCLAGQTPICQPLSMIRRSVMEQIGEYDPVVETAEDNDMWLRLGEVGKLMCVPYVLLRYRQHPRSVSELKAREQARRIQIGCEKAYARRGLERQFVPPREWRPMAATDRYRFHLQYGWWAFNNARRSTALLYGLKAIAHRPFAIKGWTLLTAALLKPQPAPPPPPEPVRRAWGRLGPRRFALAGVGGTARHSTWHPVT